MRCKYATAILLLAGVIFSLTAATTDFNSLEIEASNVSKSAGATTDPPPEFELNGSLWFPYVEVGDTSTEVCYIINQGGGWININPGDICLYNDSEESFSLNAESLPCSIGPGESYSFSVNFHPVSADPEWKEGYLSIEDNLPGRVNHYYEIRGQACLEFGYGSEIWGATVNEDDVTLHFGLILPVRAELYPGSDRSFLGVNIFRDSELIAYLDDYEFWWYTDAYYTDFDVPNGIHSYNVQSVHSFGTGPMSYPFSVVVNTLGIPQLSIQMAEPNVILEWDPVANAEWYGIYTADSLEGNWTCLEHVYAPAVTTQIPAPLGMSFFRITAGVGPLTLPVK